MQEFNLSSTITPTHSKGFAYGSEWKALMPLRMKSSFFLLTGLLAAAIAHAQMPKQHSVISIPEIVKRESPSVLRVDVLDRSGNPAGQATGVVVSSGGIFATNYHVLENACDLSIKDFSGRRLSVVALVFVDPEKDLAILRLSDSKLRPATLGDSSSLSVGQKLIAIGNPMGLEQSVSEGIVSAMRKVGPDTLIQTTAPISPGSSGGGLYTGRGELVGITTFTLRDSQNLNFAIPINALKALLRRHIVEVEWPEAVNQFCSSNSPTFDSAAILGLIDRSLFSSDVRAMLQNMNGGEDPSTCGSGENSVCGYRFEKLGVIVVFNEGVGEVVTLWRGPNKQVPYMQSFRGELPLGLNWGNTPAEVHRRLGSPIPRSPRQDRIDRYDNGRFTYLLMYSDDGLEQVSVLGRRERE